MAVNVQEMVATVEQMTVKELSELVKALEEKFGVKASAGVPMMMAPMPGAAAGAGGATATAEKTSFKVVLKNAGQQKVQLIKVVKDITGKGLKESKDLVDNVPAVIKDGVNEEEANKIKEQLVAVGAEVEIQ
ncbi:50S ribosomal protein L7/L12 [bacterium HR07]|uniref:Large ribosomal subunit protein bL12 n=2 Tax=Candidatus Bipolaricaulota TaxID=67810 RepID=H5SJ92_9BACT|nr:50S ribosomal protein L7/L12 [uncultured Acetothermia bacterium]BAL58190.1 50S ribosomal protein L7/L12 [uncultured Acetothermia bacterium]BAL59898.1 50S ribosomal protein L7/L12 [Candidatus Acetothermum autotrophicum]GBC75851.1 50S ribosomal protein L7/L12 [bacterium HR07]